MPKIVQTTPDTLRAYVFHGMSLDWEGRDEAVSDCPSCGRSDGKFTIRVSDGEFNCFICGFRGGHNRFIQWLWTESSKVCHPDSRAFADDRGLLYVDTLDHWGCCVSLLSGAWLIPGHNADGAVNQLYKRIWATDRWELRPTPEVGGHSVHGVQLLDKKSETVFLTEGPWDAMVLWESLRMAKRTERGLEFTANSAASLLAHASVLAVSNCGAVGEPMRRYLELFRGKRVVLCFDNDHPKQLENGSLIDGAGLAATKRAAGILSEVAKEVLWLRWSADGCDLTKLDGFDIRDVLTKEPA